MPSMAEESAMASAHDPLAGGLAESMEWTSGAQPDSAIAASSSTSGLVPTKVAQISSSRFIAAGDAVIIFLSRDRPPMALTVAQGQQLTNTFGSFPHDDMIGLPFGAKLASRNKRGFIHLLRPTPELWTLALPHRTQILYSPDMSFISAHLGLTPGARLIEAGTGSGSFSHYATRCVARRHLQSSGHGWKGRPSARQQQRGDSGGGRRGGGEERGEVGTRDADAESEDEQESKEPVNDQEAEVLRLLARRPEPYVHPREGRVWSYEFNAGRAVKAWDEFARHGLFGTLALYHRNVVKLGFGLENAADAVFLDLPAPWEALQHAATAMRQDVATRICCFSPCVEQVLKTVAALRRGGVPEGSSSSSNGVTAAVGSASGGEEGKVESSSTLATRWTDIETYECLSRTHLSVWTGLGTMVPNAPIDDVILRIRQVEEKKSRRRELQIARARKERLKKLSAQEDDENVVPTEGNYSKADNPGVKQEEEEAAGSGNVVGEKRKRGDDAVKREDDASASEREELVVHAPVKQRDLKKSVRPSNIFSRPMNEMRGHTSYLTFATLLPRNVQREADPTLERERELAQRKAQAIERAQKRKEEAQQANAS